MFSGSEEFPRLLEYGTIKTNSGSKEFQRQLESLGFRARCAQAFLFCILERSGTQDLTGANSVSTLISSLGKKKNFFYYLIIWYAWVFFFFSCM